MGQCDTHYGHGRFRSEGFGSSGLAGCGRRMSVPDAGTDAFGFAKCKAVPCWTAEGGRTRVLPGLLLVLFLIMSVIPATAQSGAAAAVPDEASDDVPLANPGRPTVATPATLTPVGYLQFETGYLGAWNSPGVDSQ